MIPRSERTRGSNAALVAPKADVEAVAEAEAEITASLGEPWRVAVELCGSAAFRHQQDAGVGDFEAGAKAALMKRGRAAAILDGRHKASHVQLLVVPGSQAVREQAEAEGLDRIFKAAGAEWRYAGCSMCLGMNPDQLRPRQRCASTSNRNFEGRQGKGGRTHLVSPEMAAAAAVAGKFVDIRRWPQIDS